MANRTIHSPRSTSADVSDTPAKRQVDTRNLEILVADDTPAYQKFLRQLLQDRGHAVTIVSDGQQALDCYLARRFDAIVVDLQMPVMNGLEFARSIRERQESSDQRTPILALTAHDQASARAAGAAAGIDEYLTKPIDAARFVEAVEQLASRTEGRAMKTSHTLGTHALANSDKNGVRKNGDSGAIVDFDGAMTRLGGDRELFQEFISVYDEDMPTLLEALQNASRTRDRSGVERNAHSLRGLISNFGARRAVEAAAQLEDIAKHTRWEELLDALSKLEQEVRLLTEALDSYRKR